MSRRMTFTVLLILCALTTGCPRATTVSWTIALDDLKAEPAAPTPDTAVTVKFRVTCRRTGGSGNKPISVIAEVRRADVPGVITDRVSCSIGLESAHEAGTFVGHGHAQLGKLPAGKHRITVSLQPQGDGWAMPPAQVIDVAVKEPEQ
jgi:hypothetical protein